MQAGLNARSLAAAGIPPSAPDLMSGSVAVTTPPDTQPMAAAYSIDTPYTPSAPVPLSDTAAASTPARGGRYDPRARASAGAATAHTGAATAAQAQPPTVATSPPPDGTDVEDMDLAKTLASMAPAESAALLESIMQEAPAVRHLSLPPVAAVCTPPVAGCLEAAHSAVHMFERQLHSGRRIVRSRA